MGVRKLFSNFLTSKYKKYSNLSHIETFLIEGLNISSSHDRDVNYRIQEGIVPDDFCGCLGRHFDHLVLDHLERC